MEVLPKHGGDPEIFDHRDVDAAARTMAEGVLASVPKSRRQMQNRLYALRALERLGLLGERDLRQALADRPALRWLVDVDRVRWGILSELGRIKDLERFEAAVSWVLENRLKTKEAVAWIRLFRIGRISSSTPES